jgi:mRNA deadenylase 3'-5' endonuclease subunit Ccr4
MRLCFLLLLVLVHCVSVTGFSSARKLTGSWKSTGLSSAEVELPREFFSLPRNNTTKEQQFRVLSFNVLAQALARTVMHPHVKKGTLAAKKRLPQILAELQRHDADILCLQEVDMCKFLEENLRNSYELAIYSKKTSGKCDGSAIFFNPDAFVCCATERIRFGVSLIDGIGVIALLESLQCDGVGGLEKSGQRICVVTTHLYWKPRHDGIRMRQLEILLKAVDEFCIKYQEKCSDRNRTLTKTSSADVRLPVLITGDFNSLPGSLVYNSLQGAEVSIPRAISPRGGKTRYGKDLDSVLAGDEPTPGNFVNSGHPEKRGRRFHNPLGLLRSSHESYLELVSGESPPSVGSMRRVQVADGIQRLEGWRGSHELADLVNYNSSTLFLGNRSFGSLGRDEPLFTTYSDNFSGCLDYIFYSPDSLRVASLLGLPKLERVSRMTALPSADFPSDHLPLVVDFTFSPKPDEKIERQKDICS